MKILMTTDTVGGVWHYSLELLGQLASDDVQVALATMGAPLRADQWAAVEELPHVEVHESHYKLCWMDEPWADVDEAGRWLQSLAGEECPDVVHLNDFPHGALDWPCPVLMVGHSCVLSWFESVRHEAAGPEWARYRDAVTRGLRGADMVVAPTAAMLQSLRRHYGPLPRARVIANGCRCDRFPPGPKERLVFTAGRIWDDAKNVSAVVSAAPSIGAAVAIAGEARHPDAPPPDEADPGDGQAELGGVRFLGRLDAAELARWYARSAIYALPARYEPFGLSVLEAALAGCALVLGDIATLREIWGDDACYVPPEDPDALAATINALIDDPSARLAMARRSRARALRMTPRRMTELYKNCYQTLTDATPKVLETPCDV